MAEFLIRKAGAYADALSVPSAYREGDFVAVYADGVCRENPSPKSVHCIVRVPELSLEAARAYLAPVRQNKRVVLRSRYFLDFSRGKAGAEETVKVRSEILDLTKDEFTAMAGTRQ